ncbi:iron-sulfur cluster insertion protein ErpA [Mongoliimonas terrestris]|uniref:iron-sulfur cluster insertion protein ErpA n=1 Tax=Mongoliimonas terrestris TaxID=1709001 RepID=UPI0009497CC7|nr:iron-sulfur cluster insertion protein ErpA [Mongoliimonas terrestris]
MTTDVIDRTAEPVTADGVSVTDRAARRIRKIMDKDPTAGALRVSVEGGGCSGFSYKFDLTASRADDDLVIEKDGATVLIDPTSLPFMAGSEIDFVDDLMGQSFQIRNPNATASCGCGTSFAV